MKKTHISRAIESAGQKAQYDEHVKNILGNKVIMAWILKSAVAEVADMTIENIILSIVDEIEISAVLVYPGETNRPEHYDKMAILMIYLNAQKDRRQADIFHLLNVLLSPVIKVNEKKKILNHKFGIQMEKEIGEELNEMCNLSEAIEQQGIEQGVQQGIEQGACALIETLQEMGITREEIILKLEEKFELSDSRAQAYVQKYWKDENSRI